MTVYSFSRLKNFTECQMAYWLSYETEFKKKENIYGVLGSSFHDQVESLQKGEITNQQAADNFEMALIEADWDGLKFPNEKIAESYKKSIIHAIQNFTPLNANKFEIEKEFETEINGVKLKGFIDLILHDDDGVHIVDFKTSSKYSAKDLKKNANQLLIYAIALEQQGYKIKSLSWFMNKYAIIKNGKRKKTVQRHEIPDDYDGEIENYFIYYDYNDETKQDCIDWITNTVDEIESKGLFGEYETRELTKFTTFACANICSVAEHCEKYQAFKRKNTW